MGLLVFGGIKAQRQLKNIDQLSSLFSQPVFIVDDTIINRKDIAAIGEQNIVSVSLYKNKETLPSYLKKFADLVGNGIIHIRTKNKTLDSSGNVITEKEKTNGKP